MQELHTMPQLSTECRHAAILTATIIAPVDAFEQNYSASTAIGKSQVSNKHHGVN